VGYGGVGVVNHTAGAHEIGGTLTLGREPNAAGVYQVHAGDLRVHDLDVGPAGAGVLCLCTSAPNVTVSGVLRIGPAGEVEAPAGAAVRLTGRDADAADLDILSTDPNALAALGDLNVILEGGTGSAADVEAAGRDLGLDANGWCDNASLAALTLGAEGGPAGRIKLQDAHDNQPGWAGPEALYVDRLVIRPRAAVDLSDANLYFRTGADANDPNHPKRLYPGDATLDGQVSAADLSLLADHWGAASGMSWRTADFTGDGQVSAADLSLLADHWGAGTAPLGAPDAMPVGVPEPASAAALALVAAAILPGRRTKRRPRPAD
jgi:hypothetical protein